MAPVRDTRLDATRGVAIVLVVLGHARGIPGWFSLLAFSFHVPLFFLLSGWVGAAHGAGKGAGTPLPRLARSLLLPYLGFFLLAYLYWLLTRNIGGKAARWGDLPWWDPLAGALHGSGPGLYVQPALWFLPALFLAAASFHYLSMRLKPAWIAVATAVLAWAWMTAFPPLGMRLPWGLDVLPVALFFVSTGAVLGRSSMATAPARLPAGYCVLLLAAWLPLAWLNGRVDINQLRFGQWPALFLLVALLGAALAFRVGASLRDWRVAQWLGRNSLLILCSHFLVFFVLSGLRSLAGVPSPPGPGWALGISLVALLAAVPLRWLLARAAPWMLGLRAGADARDAAARRSLAR